MALSERQVLDLYSNWCVEASCDSWPLPLSPRARSIKLSSENKITAKNSWSLALIDHLSDLVKSEQEEDTSTNFQKARRARAAPARRARA